MLQSKQSTLAHKFVFPPPHPTSVLDCWHCLIWYLQTVIQIACREASTILPQRKLRAYCMSNIFAWWSDQMVRAPFPPVLLCSQLSDTVQLFPLAMCWNGWCLWRRTLTGKHKYPIIETAIGSCGGRRVFHVAWLDAHNLSKMDWILECLYSVQHVKPLSFYSSKTDTKW